MFKHVAPTPGASVMATPWHASATPWHCHGIAMAMPWDGRRLDEHPQGAGSKDLSALVVESRAAVLALEDLGIDVIGLVETADHIFEEHGKGDLENGLTCTPKDSFGAG